MSCFMAGKILTVESFVVQKFALQIVETPARDGKNVQENPIAVDRVSARRQILGGARHRDDLHVQPLPLLAIGLYRRHPALDRFLRGLRIMQQNHMGFLAVIPKRMILALMIFDVPIGYPGAALQGGGRRGGHFFGICWKMMPEPMRFLSWSAMRMVEYPTRLS